MKVLILTNGDYGDYSFCQDVSSFDYIICADNGMKHAKYLNITPHLILGDFDSSNESDLVFYEAQGIEVIRFSSQKDETDTEIALLHAMKKGATEVAIWGGVGSRLDHTLANVQLLYKALKQNVKTYLMNTHNEVYLIDKEIKITGKANDLVSLLPFTPTVEGVTTNGLAYALTKGCFTFGAPYGVSNYMTESHASVCIDSGVLIVIKARD